MSEHMYVCIPQSDSNVSNVTCFLLARETLALVVFQGCQDHEVLKEMPALKGSRARQENVGPLDPLECQVHLG